MAVRRVKPEALGAALEAVGADVEAAMDAVYRASIEDTVQDAQATRGEGGRMPVVTGFLRNSLAFHLAGQPVATQHPPSDREAKRAAAGVPAPVPAHVSAREAYRSTWTAAYAYPVEARYRFALGAAERWDEFVRANAARLAAND